MKRPLAFTIGGLAAALLAACATPSAGPSASAGVQARSGSTVQGSVSFTPLADGVRIDARLSGLTPGEHGFHIHEAGDCSAADASSAKGHFNPAGKMHGHHASPEHHGGDLPNLLANAQGEARYSADLIGVSLTSGANGLVGRSVVVHADADDYKS